MIRRIIQRTRSILNSGITGLLVGVALPAIENYIKDAFIKQIALGTVYIAIAIVVCSWIASIVFDIVQKRRLLSSVFYSSISFDWRVSEKGDFDGTYDFVLVNNSRQIVNDLPAESLIWFTKPVQGSFRIESISNEQRHQITRGVFNIYKSVLNFILKSFSYSITWDYKVSPPLLPNEFFHYRVSISTKNTEVDALSEIGTYAGIPASIPIRDAALTYTCPLTHEFKSIEHPIILDIRGNRVNTDQIDIPLPKISSNASILTWRLQNLQPNRRYWFRYRVVKRS